MNQLCTVIVLLIIIILLYWWYTSITVEGFNALDVYWPLSTEDWAIRPYLYEGYLASDDDQVFRSDFDQNNLLWDYEPLYDEPGPYRWYGP